VQNSFQGSVGTVCAFAPGSRICGNERATFRTGDHVFGGRAARGFLAALDTIFAVFTDPGHHLEAVPYGSDDSGQNQKFHKAESKHASTSDVQGGVVKGDGEKVGICPVFKRENFANTHTVTPHLMQGSILNRKIYGAVQVVAHHGSRI